MNKVYDRIQWENYPSEATPLNEMNLNKMDAAVDALDDRVIYVDTVKAGIDDISSLVQSITYREDTGTFTVTKKNGESFSIDTKLEKLAVNFSYNAQTQQLIITLDDGTKQNVDLSALITQYEFLDTDTVAFSVDAAGRISAIIKDACIQEKHLQSDYLGNIKVEVAKANASQTAAALSETNAAKSAETAKSYAVGGTATRENEDTDNAKYYKEETQKLYNAMGEGYVTGIKGDAETEYRAGDVNITPEDIGVEAGANKTSVDVALSSTSMNPVQNKVVAAALDECAKIGGIGYSDVNELVNEGMYIAFRCTNMPGDLEYCGVIVAKAGTTLNDTKIRQIAFNSNGYDIYTRYTSDYTDGDHAWSEWKKMLTAEDISKSTAITTAGTYALDAVQNNANVSGTLANRTKKLEDTIGKVYAGTKTGVPDADTWKTVEVIKNVPAGTYLVTRKAWDVNGGNLYAGANYTVGKFTAATSNLAAIYTEIVELKTVSSIYTFYIGANGNSSFTFETEAVRLK